MTIHTLDLGEQADALDDLRVQVERLNGLVVPLAGDSDRTRRQAAAERARVTKELLELGHKFDKVKLAVLDEYFTIVREAKAAQ